MYSKKSAWGNTFLIEHDIRKQETTVWPIRSGFSSRYKNQFATINN